MFSIFSKDKDSKGLVLIDNFKPGSWIDLSEPDEKEIDKAVSSFGLDKSLLSDSLDQHEMPRLEIEDGITYIYIRVPEKINDDLLTFPLLIVLGKDFLLTVSGRKSTLFNNFISGRVTVDPAKRTEFILKLLLAVNDKYQYFITDISRRLRSIKLRLKKIDVKDILQFVDFEQVLNDFISSLVPLNSVFQKVLSSRYIKLEEEYQQDLAEDAVLGNSQLIELAKSYLRYALNIKDTHSNIATHELNRVIKILTVFTIVLTIPNMVFGFFGMNVPLPLGLNPHASLIIFFSTFLFLGTLSFILIKKRWL